MLTSPRPRRTRQESAKHYDAERKDLGLTEVLGLLDGYADLGHGGINCGVCGKLYKSRVCFIKHLWEHTVYWDLFEGDKNHMRVLSIQAALILYCTSGHSRLPVSVESLLVTSPNSEHQAKDPPSPGKETVPVPLKIGFVETEANTPVVAKPAFIRTGSDVLTPHNARELPSTPVKKPVLSTMPRKPVKKNKRKSTPYFSDSQKSSDSAEVGSFFVASPGVEAEDLYWKEADNCPCKRKRSE